MNPAVWPAARTYFAEMRYKPPPRFVDGFLLRPARARRDAVAA